MVKLCLLLWAAIITVSHAQHSGRGRDSLKPAIDALHRHAIELAMQEPEDGRRLGFNNAYMSRVTLPMNRRVDDEALNDLLYDYSDDNEVGDAPWLDERKRSVFRERDTVAGAAEANSPLHPSVFRERSNPHTRKIQNAELALDFLRQLDHNRDGSHSEIPRRNIIDAIEQYEENERAANEREIIAEELERSGLLDPEPFNRKEHAIHLNSVADAIAAEKRQMTLPWLPASRRKRFPVTKRSPKSDSFGMNEKVARDLQAIFGAQTGEAVRHDTESDSVHKVEKKSEHSTYQNERQHQHHHQQQHHAIGEASSEEDSEEDEDDETPPKHHETHPIDEVDDSDFDDDDDDEENDRKRKRSAAGNGKINEPKITSNGTTINDTKPESNKEQVFGLYHIKEHSVFKDNVKQKKSIDWSKYFGLDRKKKSADDWFMSKHDKSSSNDGPHSIPLSRSEIAPRENLDNIDENLKTIENRIIDDAIKYAGSKQGTTKPNEIEDFKNHMVSRLATAYNLEKMRKTLAKLRESRERNQHLDNNEITDSSDDSRVASLKTEKAKRIAVKKEKVEYDNTQQSLDADADENHPSKGVQHNVADNQFEEPPSHYVRDNDKRRKKKRNGGGDAFATFPFDGDRFASRGHLADDLLDECPVFDAIDKRCQHVDIISGGGIPSGFGAAILPACGMHQFCYLCGSSLSACDFQFLTEIKELCGLDRDCQTTAHLVLSILRESTADTPRIGPKECVKNPCLLQAMRSNVDY